jgi:hypothetical protein
MQLRVNLIFFYPAAAHSSSNSSVVFPAFDRQIFQPINALKTLMKDNNIWFRTFICLSMSKGMLMAWLEALRKQKSEWGYIHVHTCILRVHMYYRLTLQVVHVYMYSVLWECTVSCYSIIFVEKIRPLFSAYIHSVFVVVCILCESTQTHTT